MFLSQLTQRGGWPKKNELALRHKQFVEVAPPPL